MKLQKIGSSFALILIAIGTVNALGIAESNSLAYTDDWRGVLGWGCVVGLYTFFSFAHSIEWIFSNSCG